MLTFFICITGILLLVLGILGYKLIRLSKAIESEVKTRVHVFLKNYKAEVEKFKTEKVEWEKIKKETDANTKGLYDQFAKREADLYEKSEKLDNEYQEYKNELKQNYDQRMQEAEAEIEAAMQEAEEAIKTNISEMDILIENRLSEIAAKNTRMFNCVCNDKPIPCFIDFTEENTCRCPDCGTVYRIEITMNPVIIGKAISDEAYVELIKNRIENGI